MLTAFSERLMTSLTHRILTRRWHLKIRRFPREGSEVGNRFFVASLICFSVCLSDIKAGIATSANADQLLIALEPEAASIHIRRLRMRQLVPEKPLRRPLTLRPDNDVDAVGGGQETQQVATKFTQRKWHNTVQLHCATLSSFQAVYKFYMDG